MPTLYLIIEMDRRRCTSSARSYFVGREIAICKKYENYFTFQKVSFYDE